MPFQTLWSDTTDSFAEYYYAREAKVTFEPSLAFESFTGLPGWLQGTILISVGSIIVNLAYIIQKVSFNKQKSKRQVESRDLLPSSFYDNETTTDTASLTHSGSTSAYSRGGKRRNLYLHPLWLLGLFILLIGQLLCFYALHLVPQSLAATLSVLSLFSNVVLSKFFLGESSPPSQFRGMLYVAVGCILLFIASPRAPQRYMVLSDVIDMASSTGFVAYASVLTAALLILYCLKSLLPDSATILACMASVLNSICSVLAKCLSHLITSSYFPPEEVAQEISKSLKGHSTKVASVSVSTLSIASMNNEVDAVSKAVGTTNQFYYFGTWVIVVLTISLAVLSLHLFNKALRYDKATRMYPLYFGLSGLLGVLLGLAFFKEHRLMSFSDVLLFCLGVGFVAWGLRSILSTEEADYSRIPLYVDHEAQYDDEFEYLDDDEDQGEERRLISSGGTSGDRYGSSQTYEVSVDDNGNLSYIYHQNEPSSRTNPSDIRPLRAYQ